MPTTHIYGLHKMQQNARSASERMAVNELIQLSGNNSKGTQPVVNQCSEVPIQNVSPEIAEKVIYVEKPVLTFENIFKIVFWKNFFGL